MTAPAWPDTAELPATAELPPVSEAGRNGNGQDKAARPPTHPGEHSIPRHRHLEVARHIVVGDVSRAQLARQFSISRSGMSQWCRRHRGLIEQVRASADLQYSAVYFADKTARLWALQQEYEASAAQPDALTPEHIRVRAQLLRAVAEEIGDLPPRQAVMVVPVRHILEGCDLDLLR